MARILYVHWNESEASERVKSMTDAGHDVRIHWSTQSSPSLKGDLPEAFIISLDRLPSHGRAVAEWFREAKSRRGVPIVFEGGKPGKVAVARERFPEAQFCEPGLTAVMLDSLLTVDGGSKVQADHFLETERLIIRNWQADDWLLVRPMSLDLDVTQYIGHYRPWSEQETRQFATNRIADYERHGWTMWPLVLKDTGGFVGYCGFLRRQYGEYKDQIEIGYALAKDAWGKGLAAEAGARILEYGFGALGFDRIIASARPENARSIRVMEKMGMRSIGLSLNDKGRLVPHYAIENPKR